MDGKLVVLALSLPILFVLHNLEEVIVFEHFMRTNRAKLTQRLPGFIARRILAMGSASTAGFGLAITILTVVFVVVSYGAVWLNSHVMWLIWLSGALVFAVQLAVHVISAIVWRGYAFGTVTSVIFLPILAWMAENLLSSMAFSWQEIVTAFLIVYAAGYVGGVLFLHGWLIPAFDRRFGQHEPAVP